jgi:hypothetical protein
MHRLIRSAVALVSLLGCEQRYSNNPPPLLSESLAPGSSPSAVDALPAAGATDAGPAVLDLSHSMTVTICSSNTQPCRASAGDASQDASYHVVFGSGRGAIRSRGQAMMDLYEELRNRIASGERLDAEAHALGDAGASAVLRGGATSASSSDPIARCAFDLLDVVDRVGEVTLDVVHGAGSSGCTVSLDRFAADGGAAQCLVKEPEREHAPSGGGLKF